MTVIDLLTLRRIRFRRSYGDQAEITLNCPFCIDRGKEEDTGFHYGLNVRTGEGHCFRCNWASRKYGVKAYLSKLGEKGDDVEQPLVGDEPAKVEKIALPEGYDRLTLEDAKDDMTGPAWKYLRDRGVTEKQIHRNRIGVCLTGRYAYRVVFPVRFEKKLKGFVARDFTGKAKVRYLNSIGEKSLYNLEPASDRKTVILSEGIFKCLRIERATNTRSAAILGNTITDEQIQQLQKMGYQQVILWPDPNQAGIRGSMTTADRLSENGISVSTIYPVPEIEADELAIPDLKATYLNRVFPMDWERRMKILSTAAFPA